LTAIIEYVYCVVPASLAIDEAPRGMDRSPVRRIVAGELAALVSSLDASEYADGVASERMAEPEWLAPRAVVHDAVVTWADDRGAVVPFPMWVMFSDESAVAGMLATRAAEFRGVLDRVRGAREFGVRVVGTQAAIATAAEKVEPAIAELERQASTASPGQAYLLRRKLEETRKAATRDTAALIAAQTHDALSVRARASLARATTISNEPGVLLDGAYLVSDEQYEPFRKALTALIETYEPTGLRFDFTGPWPPYHFVRDD
jgi:hypothetical protein